MEEPTRLDSKEPCYAVIFTSFRSTDVEGYAEMAARMEALARAQPGFLGVDSVREGKLGITVSYWSSLEAIAAWRMHVEHQVAQSEGRRRWYDAFTLHVTRVIRSAQFDRNHESHAAPEA